MFTYIVRTKAVVTREYLTYGSSEEEAKQEALNGDGMLNDEEDVSEEVVEVTENA